MRIDDEEKLIGKTIVLAEINGFYVRLKFSDGSIFDYSSSDGGYSSWEIIDDTTKAEGEIDNWWERSETVNAERSEE